MAINVMARFEDGFFTRGIHHDLPVVLLEIVPGDRELPTVYRASGDAGFEPCGISTRVTPDWSAFLTM